MDPLHRYATSLKKSKSFFEGGKKTPKGTPITQSQLLKLYQNRADCPVCGAEFSGTNNNTEHIHPRALGGTNEATNKIQMCKLCNHCRNSVMQHHLVGPPYSKSYPQMWDAIQRFIMWSEITIDDGLQAGEIFPDIHQAFMDERFAGLTPPKGPSRAFGRASTIDGADAPNYPHNRARGTTLRPLQTPIRPTTKKGFWERFATPVLDFMTGYGRGQPPSTKITAKKIKNELEEAKQPSPVKVSNEEVEAVLPAIISDEKRGPKVSLEARTIEQFVEFMMGVLTDAPQELSIVGRIIERHLGDLNAEFTSTTYFLQLHGLPPGLKKGIEMHLGSRVKITEKSGKQYVALSTSESLLFRTKAPTNKCPEVDESFQMHVYSALRTVESEVKLSTLSTILGNYLESIGQPKRSFKQFAKSFGIPTTRTAIEVIEHYFPNAIGYRREGETVVFIWPVTTEEE